MVKHIDNVKFIYQFNWVDTIKKFAFNLNPEQSVIVFNQGLWGGGQMANVTVQKEIVQALKDCDIFSIYKTTTKTKDDKSKCAEEYDQQISNQTDMCFYTSWTGPLLPSSYYVDHVECAIIVNTDITKGLSIPIIKMK